MTMRILFLSNLYPPAGNGGYEQWCQEVAEGLLARGHAIRVLTTGRGRGPHAGPEPGWVCRELHMEMEFASLVHGVRFFTARDGRERANLETLSSHITDFAPDLVFIWGMWNLPRSLAALAERRLPGRVVYYLADYWPTLPSQHEFYWQAPARSWATRLPKGLLRPLAQLLLKRKRGPVLEFDRAILPSEFLKDELLRKGAGLRSATVIPGAVNTAPFLAASRIGGQTPGRAGERPLALLYAGRLAPEKGIETAIAALGELVHRRGQAGVHLSIAGSGERSYTAHLQALVAASGLGRYVTFFGPVAKEAMPGLYAQHDIFLFTSTWQEPFGRVLVEALAAGVVVIGTATGGAAEILVEGETGLTFTAGDPAGLAGQVERVRREPGLAAALAANGQRIAVERFDIRRMVAEIEDYLRVAVPAT